MRGRAPARRARVGGDRSALECGRRPADAGCRARRTRPADHHHRAMPTSAANAIPASTVLIGPQGTPAAISSGNHSAAVRRASRCVSSGRSCSRLAVRSWLCANRGRRAALGPRRRRRAGELRVVARGHDEVAIAGRQRLASGTGWGESLPIRNGTTPLAAQDRYWLTIPYSVEDIDWPRCAGSRQGGAGQQRCHDAERGVRAADHASTEIPSRNGGPAGPRPGSSGRTWPGR